MRKITSYHYSEGDVKKIVRTEFEVAKLEWLGEFKSLVTKFKDEVMIGLDKVMGELKTIREEQEIITGRNSEHRETLENHDTRIGKLEHTFKSA